MRPVTQFIQKQEKAKVSFLPIVEDLPSAGDQGIAGVNIAPKWVMREDVRMEKEDVQAEKEWAIAEEKAIEAAWDAVCIMAAGKVGPRNARNPEQQ